MASKYFARKNKPGLVCNHRAPRLCLREIVTFVCSRAFSMAKPIKTIVGLLLTTLALHLAASISSAAEKTPPAAHPPFLEKTKAWAMLCQMMERLRLAVAQGELTLIDPEDPFASAAVSSLLAELGKAPSPENGLLRVKWIQFVRHISAMHEAADKNNLEAVMTLMQKLEEEFQELRKRTDPQLLEDAEKLAGQFTCPMHPDVIGKKSDLCPKCGMTLDQPMVILPVQSATGVLTSQHTVMATISLDAPLQAGKLARAVLHLRRAMDHPVTRDQLIETHTHKIHLLLVDGSLTDYHHEHPELTDVPGDYEFEFTPTKPGPYYAWADLRPLPFGLQEYDKTIVAGKGESEPISTRRTKLSSDLEGFHFELKLGEKQPKAGEPIDAELRVTHAGKGFDQLEPVMGAFAHLVGFYEDMETVLHMHPTGEKNLRDSDRGGPLLHFKFYAAKPGFMRLFAQVQIQGRQVFAPFAVTIAE